MSGLKLLRNRIRSIKSTQKITKAMHMVAVAKFYRIKEAAIYNRLFLGKITDILNLAKSKVVDLDLLPKIQSMLAGTNNPKLKIAIIISSDKGLCGNYNSSLNRYLSKALNNDDYNLKVITIGNKFHEYYSAEYKDKILMHLPISGNLEEISEKIFEKINQIADNELDINVRVYYTKFINILTRTPDEYNLWPIESGINQSENSGAVEFEGEGIIEEIISFYQKTSLMSAIYNSRASEEASRMTTMDNASKNAGEMIHDLTLKMNRTRQAHITKELIEVISGAEALK